MSELSLLDAFAHIVCDCAFALRKVIKICFSVTKHLFRLIVSLCWNLISVGRVAVILKSVALTKSHYCVHYLPWNFFPASEKKPRGQGYSLPAMKARKFILSSHACSSWFAKYRLTHVGLSLLLFWISEKLPISL